MKTLCIFILAACAAFGASIQFVTAPVNQAFITGVGDVRVGPVGVLIDGTPAFIVCDDASHETTIPSGPFNYNVSTLPNLTYARFAGEFAADVRYEAAAILLKQMFDTSNHDAIASYQAAIWEDFNVSPTFIEFGNSTNLLADAYIHSADAGNQSLYDSLRIYTPAGKAGSNQEFIGLVTTGTPEPATYLMAGMTMLAFGIVGRRKRQQV